MKRFFPATGRTLPGAASAHWLLAACALWLLATAGWRPLMLPDEGRYIGVAWEMLNSGNWLVPTLDGLPFFHKPPLFYWITAAALQLFGAHAWAGRMASLLAAIATLVAIHAFVRRHRDSGSANLTAVILATQPFFFGAAQFANLDMLVASMITLTIVCIADAALRIDLDQSATASLAAGYAFAALGMLAKGLIGLLLPAAIVFLWLLLRGKLRLLPRLLNPLMIVLLLAIAAPWFVAMTSRFPDFPDYFFLEQHFRRFTGSGFNNAQPFWFYLPVLLLLSFPWSLWCARLVSEYRRRSAPDTDGIRLLMWAWLALILLFFSIPASKLVGYILPALPPFAFLLADAGKRWLERDAEAAARWLGISVLASVVLCVSLVGYLRSQDPSRLSRLDAQAAGFAPGDQLVMLDQYPYDLPFYLRATTAAWVVGNWQDPAVGKADNWRKELADAGRFDPQAKAQQLISAQELTARLCARPDVRYWIWSRLDTLRRVGWLASAEQVFTNGRQALWRLRPADTNGAVCATP